MRQLTVKQKKFLNKWFDRNKDKLRGFSIVDDFMDAADWDKIVAMNDTEILYQQVNSYLCDKFHSPK